MYFLSQSGTLVNCLFPNFDFIKHLCVFMFCNIDFTGYQTKNYWIDGNNIEAQDFSSLSEWVTSTGEQLRTDFWFPGQPNKPYTDHCAYLNTENSDYSGLLCDMDCNINFNFICEKNEIERK